MSQVYVGRFSEQDLSTGQDKAAVEKAMQETGLNYTNTKLVKRKGEIIAMDVWVCDATSFRV